MRNIKDTNYFIISNNHVPLKQLSSKERDAIVHLN